MPVGKKSISQFERNPAEPSKGAAIAQKQQRPEAAFMGKQLGFPLMRLVKAEQALDFSPQTFTWFLSSNFNSSLFQFSNNMSLLSADECRTIRELYWKEIDSGYKTAILDHLQWSDPLSITFRGENGTGRFGKSANKILGFCLPDADEHAVGSVQAKLFEAFGSLGNYLRQKRGAADGQLAEAFASLVGEIWDMKGSGKECVISAIRDAFGDEIDANFRTDFLKQAGWYDPLCIKNRAGGESVASKGILYGKLLGLEPTRCLSPMQRSILKEIHGSFDAYISNCHQGGLSAFIDNLSKTGNCESQNDFAKAMREEFHAELDSPKTRDAILRALGLYDPLDAYLPPGSLSRHTSACALFGWWKPRMSPEERGMLVMESVCINVHKTFSAYIQNCYGGSVMSFTDRLLQAEPHVRANAAFHIRQAFGAGFDIGKYKTQIMKHLGFYDPLEIANSDTSFLVSNGNVVANLLGTGSVRSTQNAQMALFFAGHGSLPEYLRNCHNGSFKSYLGKLRGLDNITRAYHIRAVRQVFPALGSNREENAAILAEFHGKDPATAPVEIKDIRAIAALFGVKGDAETGVRALLLSRFATFEDYLACHHNGSHESFVAAYNSLGRGGRNRTNEILYRVFVRKKPLAVSNLPDARLVFTSAGIGRRRAASIGWISDTAAKRLHFPPKLIDEMRKSSMHFRVEKRGRDNLYFYSYAELTRRWLEPEYGVMVSKPESEAMRKAIAAHRYSAKDAELAFKAALLCMETEVEARTQSLLMQVAAGEIRAEFISNGLPRVLGLLQELFGEQSPHALAGIARMNGFKYAEWSEIADAVSDYLSLVKANPRAVLPVHGFVPKNDDVHGQYWEKHYSTTSGSQVSAVVLSTPGLPVSIFAGSVEVPESLAGLSAEAKEGLERLESVLADLRPNIVTFVKIINERTRHSIENTDRSNYRGADSAAPEEV